MIVRHALLALLSEGPKYGFQLAQEFEAETGEMWPLNTGQVYTTLQRLERDESVESDDAVEDGPDGILRVLANQVARLAHAKHLLAGGGVLRSRFTCADSCQDSDKSHWSHFILLSWICLND